jgi:hypothetical protein
MRIDFGCLDQDPGGQKLPLKKIKKGLLEFLF